MLCPYFYSYDRISFNFQNDFILISSLELQHTLAKIGRVFQYTGRFLKFFSPEITGKLS